MNSKPDIVVRAEAYKDDINVPCTLLFNYPTSDTEAIECGVLFDNVSDIPKVYPKDEDPSHYLQIRSINAHKELWIPRMRIEYTHRKYSDSSYRGIAELLFEGGLSGFQAGEGKLECYVLLQDNALLSSYDDENFTTWMTPFGPAMLKKDYRYGGYVRDMQEQKPYKRHLIHITLDSQQYQSMDILLIEFTKYLVVSQGRCEA